MDVGINCSRIYFDILADAKAYGTQIDYDRILELDSQLMRALEQRPNFLRPDTTGLDPRFRSSSILVSCTLWHRLFIIHRPFLLLSQTDPDRYGLSALRTWDNALLTIRNMRVADTRNIVQFPLQFRLMQAALVVITHLFLWPQRLNLHETMVIHDGLQYVISSIRDIENSNTGSRSGIFSGQSSKLEALLAASSKIKRPAHKVNVEARSPLKSKPIMSDYQNNSITASNSVFGNSQSTTANDLGVRVSHGDDSASLRPDTSAADLSAQTMNNEKFEETQQAQLMLDEQLMCLLRETGAQYLGYGTSDVTGASVVTGIPEQSSMPTMLQSPSLSLTLEDGHPARVGGGDDPPTVNSSDQDVSWDILTLVNGTEV